MKKNGPHRSQSLSAFPEHKLPIRIRKHHQLQITHDHRQILLHSIPHRLRQRVRRRTRSHRSSSNFRDAEVNCRQKRWRGWNGRHFLGGGGGRTAEAEGGWIGWMERRMGWVLRDGSSSVDERGGWFQDLIGIRRSSCSRSRWCWSGRLVKMNRIIVNRLVSARAFWCRWDLVNETQSFEMVRQVSHSQSMTYLCGCWGGTTRRD